VLSAHTHLEDITNIPAPGPGFVVDNAFIPTAKDRDAFQPARWDDLYRGVRQSAKVLYQGSPADGTAKDTYAVRLDGPKASQHLFARCPDTLPGTLAINPESFQIHLRGAVGAAGDSTAICDTQASPGTPVTQDWPRAIRS
jgi:hypothetical protein